MIRLTPGWGQILRINMHFLGGSLFGAAALYCWPNNTRYWEFALISIIFGMAAISLFKGGVVLIMKLYNREVATRRYLESARPPEPARLADTDALRDAGMVE